MPLPTRQQPKYVDEEISCGPSKEQILDRVPSLQLRKNLDAAKPPEQSESLGGNISYWLYGQKLYMVLKGFPNVIT